MVTDKKIIIVAAAISVAILSVVGVLALLNPPPDEPLVYQKPIQLPDDLNKQQPGMFADQPGKNNTPTLADVINTARTWQPAFTRWTGKPAPDFTLTDITGKTHTLSRYRGRNVLIIFWATWCRPCIMEIPHLIALRNIIDRDKLVMLAISNENPQRVKRFLANGKINYTVFAAQDNAAMPEPYNRVTSIPSSFFIDPDGKIKLSTAGLLSLGSIKAILQAQ